MADLDAEQSARKSAESLRASRLRRRAERGDDERVPAHLTWLRLPALRSPVLVMAFEGWNDSGEAATTAARLLVSQRDGDKIASIDPEEYFVFTDTRPYVRLTRRGRRRIDWPANEFFACPDAASGPEPRDLVVLVGTEPDLRWRAFSEMVLHVARRLGVELVIALGALDNEVPHTLPPLVSGTTANPELHPLLRNLGLRPSRYEGPTGIVGVLTGKFSEAGYPVASLWGHSPHYISASPNPVVAARLLRELAGILHISPDMEMLDEAAQRFDEQVREAVAKDPEAMAYVRDLERRYHEEHGGEGDRDDRRSVSSGELPSGAAMVNYLEEFLRQRRRPPNAGPSR
jgi:proteasome assembly chaperone (PAC2) family protein